MTAHQEQPRVSCLTPTNRRRPANFAFKSLNAVLHCSRMKIVGKRRTSEDLSPISPREALARATVLQEQAELLNPYPRPRGFCFQSAHPRGVRALA